MKFCNVTSFRLKLGLYHVDMFDKNRTRMPKKSALVYKEIIRSRIIDYDYNPDPYKNAFGVKKDEKMRGVFNAAVTCNSKIIVVLLTTLFNYSTFDIMGKISNYRSSNSLLSLHLY